MMKEISNSERWSRRLGYALTILVLIDCLVPFAWNVSRRRPPSVRIRSSDRLFDTLGKIVNGKNPWSNNNEFGLEIGIGESRSPLSEGKGFSKNEIGSAEETTTKTGLQFPYREMFGRNNLTVFILPDLRRTANGNDNMAAVASNQELSLEDSDAIDFYWRQDIDAEKGMYPNLWSPDLQYERDVQMVTEKTLLQTGYPSDTNYRCYPDQNEYLRNLIAAQKDYFDWANLADVAPGGGASDGDGKSGVVQQLEKTPMLFESTTTTAVDQQQAFDPDNAYGGQNLDLNLDWLNQTLVDGASDVFLNTNQLANGEYAVGNQGGTNSDYAFLTTQGANLDTPPVSMDWESKPNDGNSNINPNQIDNRCDPMLFDAGFNLNLNEFDSLPTPDLLLAPTDVACLFADRQVAQDVAEAQTTKEMMLHHSPIVPVDAFPSTSANDLVSFTPLVYDENYPVDGERSEVILETLGPYSVDPFSVPSIPWPQAELIPSTWNVQQPTEMTSAVASTSPTWDGDHDYVLDASAVQAGGVPFAPSYDTNSYENYQQHAVKTESYDDYEREEDDDDEEDSSEQRARAASERDELRARQLALPFSAAEIVKMSQSEYVGLTRSKGRFTREQVELIKEIRRHGGNKEAARRSRQKKVQISKQLDDEVQELERQRNAEIMENKKLMKAIEMEERAIEEAKRKNGRK